MDEVSSHKGESLCKVCGDKASGKHYGVASCDGCRGFFKRSIRRNLEYICKENGRCIVDVTRRNQCQACRFKKCLQVNMKRDAVQHERAPRASHPTIHHYPVGIGARFRSLHGSTIFSNLPFHFQNQSLLENSTITPLAPPSSSYIPQGFLYPGMLTPFPKPPGLGSTGMSMFSSPTYIRKSQIMSSPPPVIKRNVNKEDEVTSSEEVSHEKKVSIVEDRQPDDLNTNSRLELPLLNEDTKPAIPTMDVPCLSLFPAENIYESAAKLLFLAIKWARSIPSFLQLSYRDQSILLEDSWNELFVLTAAQWQLPIDEVLLISNAVAPTSRHSMLEEDARKLREIITRLYLLRVDHTEHACLKALVLFKSESRGLCEPTHVELLQDQTHVMLHEYCSQKQSHHKGRFGKLLLTLPAVQSVSRRSLEELLFRQTVGNVAIDRLLGDLAKVVYP